MRVSTQFILSLSGLILCVLSFALYGYGRFRDMQFTSNFNNEKLFHNLRMLLTESHDAHAVRLHRSSKQSPAYRIGTSAQTNESLADAPSARNTTSKGNRTRADPEYRAEFKYRSERTLMAAAAAGRRNAGADLSRIDRHQGAVQVIIMIMNWFISMFSAGIFYAHLRKKLDDAKLKKRVTVCLSVHALACGITFIITLDAVSGVNTAYLDLESMVTPADPLDGAILVASCYKSFYETYFNKVIRLKGWIEIRDSMRTCDEYAVKLVSAMFLATAGIIYGFLAYVWGRVYSDAKSRTHSTGRSESLTRSSIHKGRQFGHHISTLDAQPSSRTLHSAISKRNAQWNRDNEYRESQTTGYFR